MYLREQSWRNSFALKRWGKWCGDVVMWWCGYVVMRWKSRIRNLRHWVLCKTTAPIDNATLTDTIFFSPTLKGGKLFIVSCEFWFFLYAKIFYYSYIFKEAKLAKFIRFEAGWKLMWWCGDVVMRWKSRIRKSRHQDEVRDAACEVRVFLSQSSRRIGEMIVFLSALRNIGDVLARAQVFQFMYVEKNIFSYKEILHFAALRSEWQSSSL